MTQQEFTDRHWLRVDQRRHWATFFEAVCPKEPSDEQVVRAKEIADRLNSYLFKRYPN